MGVDHDGRRREFTGHRSARQRRRRAAAIAAASLAVAALVIACAFAAHTFRRPLGPTTTTPDDGRLMLPPGAETSYFWAGATDRDHLFVTLVDCPTVPTPEPTVGRTLSPVPATISDEAPSSPVYAVAYPAAASSTFPTVVSPWPETPVAGPTIEPTRIPCEFTLLASTNGGVNWQARSLPFPDPNVRYWLLGTETLYALTWQAVERISFDGGRTWGPLIQNPEPLDAMPAGAVPLCLPAHKGCPLTAADPLTRTIRPLRNQPPVPRTDYPHLIRPDAGLWVTGWDEARHQRLVTSSRDGGRTWSTHVISPACTDEGNSLSMDTVDGRTVYVMTYAQKTVCRSTDGGVTWQPIPAAPHMTNLDVAFVASDNAHVIGWLVHDPFRPQYVEYAASRDGGPYVKIDIAPMSTSALLNVRAAVAGGGYLTWDGHGVFRSDDSLTWYRVLPPG